MRKFYVVFFLLINIISITVLGCYNDSDGIIMKLIMVLSAFIVVHSIALLPIIYLWKKSETKGNILWIFLCMDVS